MNATLRLSLAIVSGGLILFFVGCVSAAAYTPSEDISVDSLASSISPDVTVANQGDRVILKTNRGRVVFVPGINQFSVNGESENLSFAPFYEGNTLRVPGDADRRVRSALARHGSDPVERADSDFLVMIDPGHGGSDAGAVGHNNIREKDVVLEISRKLDEELRKHGIRTALTRESDRRLGRSQSSDLDKRVQKTAQKEAGLFLSIHANAARNNSASGFEIFIAEDSDRSKNLERLKRWYRQTWEQPGGINLSRAARQRYNQNRDKEKTAARLLERKLRDVVPFGSRGIKKRSFHVLRESPAPALLLETGFLTNPREARKLADSSYQQSLARAIGEAVEEIVRLFEQRSFE